MVDRKCINVYVKDKQFCVCDDNGKEFFALESVDVHQDWKSPTGYTLSGGLVNVTFTVVANMWDSEEQMKEELAK